MNQKKIKDCTLKEINNYVQLRFENDKEKIISVSLYFDCSINVSTVDINKFNYKNINPDDFICTMINPEEIIEVEE